MSKTVLLIGYMGAGKSSVGKILAETMGVPFADLDDLIVQAEGRSIPEIFAEEGEMYFRLREQEALEKFIAVDIPMVISLGGGTPVRAENREIIRCYAPLVFYLEAKPETIYERLKEDQGRPLLQQAKTGEEKLVLIRTMLAQRQAAYEAAATHRILVDEKTPETIAEEIYHEVTHHERTQS